MHPPSQRADDLFEALRADAAATDHEGGFPLRSIGLLRDSGLLRAPLPAQHGGESLGDASQTHALLATLAAVGRGSLVVGRLYEGHVNALQLIGRFGTPAQCDKAAAHAAAGHLFGVWNTEAGNGVRLLASDGGFRLAGSKTFASGLGYVAQALVTAAREDAGGGAGAGSGARSSGDGARDGGRNGTSAGAGTGTSAGAGTGTGSSGWQMVLVPTGVERPVEDPGFWKPLGMRASASFGADFSGIRIAAGDLIGAPGDYYREPSFSAGAIRFAAVQQGGAESVFDETRRFLNRLGRTDDPYQRARLGDMAWLVESGRLWLDGAARHAAAAMSGAADDAARTVAYARMMRSAIEDIALRVLALADRSVGARGLLRPEPFERLHRDLTHYLRQPAPDAALAEAGRHVLGDGRPASALWL